MYISFLTLWAPASFRCKFMVVCGFCVFTHFLNTVYPETTKCEHFYRTIARKCINKREPTNSDGSYQLHLKYVMGNKLIQILTT